MPLYRMLLRAIVFGFVLSGLVIESYGQGIQYPVTGSLVVGGPYRSNLSYYAAGGSGADILTLNLTLNDLTLSGQAIRLRMRFKSNGFGNGINVQSKDLIPEAPVITLDGGATRQLTLQELGVYFKQEYLEGNITNDQYNLLPEGIYDLSFQVLDVYTGRALSNWISFPNFWIQYNTPPVLQKPENKDNIKGGGFYFQWSQSGGLQQSSIEYEFRLYRLLGSVGDEVAEISNTIEPLYRVTTSATNLYSNGLPLEEGARYGWLVQAKALPGQTAQAGAFQTNNSFGPGVSNLFTFTYQGNCPGVSGIQLEAKNSNRIGVTWNGDARFQSYYIKYRKAGGDRPWFEDTTSNTFLTLQNLEASTLYEVQVGVVCGNAAGGTALINYSDPQTEQTLAAGEVTGVKCGTIPEIDLKNQQLIQELKEGDVITAGDFQVRLIKVNGSSSGWSGEAYTTVPVFGDNKFAIKFNGVKVNVEKKLIGGFFETVYDSTNNGMVDVNEVMDAIDDAMEQIGDWLDKDLAGEDNWAEAFKDQIQYLPEEWKEKLELMEKELDEAKETYEAAQLAVKELGENATADEVAKAQKALEEATSKYESAKAKSETTTQELQTFLKDYGDLLKWVFQLIRDESLHFREQYRSYVQSLIEGKPSADAEQTGPGEEQTNSILFSEAAGEQQPNTQDSSTINKTRNSREFIWNRSVYACRKMDECKTKEGFLAFIDDFKQITGENLSQIVYDQQKQDKPDDDIIKESLKPKIYAFMLKLMELEPVFSEQSRQE